LRGLSQVDSVGGIFYQPEADAALFSAIKEHAAEHVKVTELDLHINDAAFAETVVSTLLGLLHKKETLNFS
jgi:uncharacterized protein (UPF0261 family)